MYGKGFKNKGELEYDYVDFLIRWVELVCVVRLSFLVVCMMVMSVLVLDVVMVWNDR